MSEVGIALNCSENPTNQFGKWLEVYVIFYKPRMIKDLVQVTLRVGTYVDTYIFEDCNRLSCQGR